MDILPLQPEAPPAGRPAPERGPLADRDFRIILAVTLMAIIGFVSIMPAIPQIMAAFTVPPERIGLVLTAFAGAAMIATPLAGMMADRLGRRRVLAPALLIFATFGVACAFARSFEQLLLFRFLQGLGAGQLNVVTSTIVGDMYEGRKRAQAMGFIGATVSIGSAGAGVLGGVLASGDWRWVFYLPGLGFACWALVVWKLRTPEPRRGGHSLGGYARQTWRLIRTRKVAGLMAATLAAMLLINGAFVTYAPVLLDERFGMGPGGIGLVLMVVTMAVGLVATQMGRLTAWVGSRCLILAGLAFFTISMVLTPLAPGVGMVMAALAVMGLGHGLIMPSVMSLLAEHAPLEHRAAVMSSNGIVMRLGQTASPVLMGACYGLGGLDGVFWAGALIGVTGLCCAAALVR